MSLILAPARETKSERDPVCQFHSTSPSVFGAFRPTIAAHYFPPPSASGQRRVRLLREGLSRQKALVPVIRGVGLPGPVLPNPSFFLPLDQCHLFPSCSMPAHRHARHCSLASNLVADLAPVLLPPRGFSPFLRQRRSLGFLGLAAVIFFSDPGFFLTLIRTLPSQNGGAILMTPPTPRVGRAFVSPSPDGEGSGEPGHKPQKAGRLEPSIGSGEWCPS